MAVTSKVRKKTKRRLVADGIVHIYASFNNTVVTITDREGNALVSIPTGNCGFKGFKKSTKHAAKVATDKACEMMKEYGMQQVSVHVNGPGPGREPAVHAVGAHFKVDAIRDLTPRAHNGCRLPKERRI